jgi:hypothetical protein
MRDLKTIDSTFLVSWELEMSKIFFIAIAQRSREGELEERCSKYFTDMHSIQ